MTKFEKQPKSVKVKETINPTSSKQTKSFKGGRDEDNDVEVAETYKLYFGDNIDSHGRASFEDRCPFGQSGDRLLQPYGELKSTYQDGDLYRKKENETGKYYIEEKRIEYKYSKRVESNKKLRDALEKFINSFIGPFDYCEGNNKHVGFYLLSEPLGLSFWRTIVKECNLKDADFLFHTFGKDEESKVITTYDTFEKMITIIGELLSVKFKMPTENQWYNYCNFAQSCSWHWEWIQTEVMESKMAKVISVVQNEKRVLSPHTYLVPRNKYAACRLVFYLQKNDKRHII